MPIFSIFSKNRIIEFEDQSVITVTHWSKKIYPIVINLSHYDVYALSKVFFFNESFGGTPSRTRSLERPWSSVCVTPGDWRRNPVLTLRTLSTYWTATCRTGTRYNNYVLDIYNCIWFTLLYLYEFEVYWKYWLTF